jgi:anti-sigma factor RsiW
VDRYDELLSEYLDGTLDAAGRDELASLIDADPARRETFVSMVREHRLLATELSDPAADVFARRVMAMVRDAGVTVVAVADRNVDCSAMFLERMGFAHVNGEVYACRP